MQKLVLQDIVKLYWEEELSIKQISEKLEVSRDRVYRLLKRNNIALRDMSHCKQKYKLNENIFERIDTQEKAYWLGMLYADGCHTPSKHEIKISLQEQDKKIIEDFKNFLNYTGPLLYRVFKDKYPTWSNQWACVVTNKKLSQDLSKLGLLKNKTYTLQFPQFIAVSLRHHFIRGFFDGDGCLYTKIAKKENKLSGVFSIVCHYNFLDDLQQIFREELGFDKVMYGYITNKNKDIGVLRYGGNHQIVMLRDYLYKDATIYMQRKKDKFDEIKVYRSRKQKYIDKKV